MRLRYAFDFPDGDQTITVEGDTADGLAIVIVSDGEASTESEIVLDMDALRSLSKALTDLADRLDPPKVKGVAPVMLNQTTTNADYVAALRRATLAL